MDMVENLQDYICTDAAPEQKAIRDSRLAILFMEVDIQAWVD